MITLVLAAMCVVVWYFGLRIVREVENQGRQITDALRDSRRVAEEPRTPESSRREKVPEDAPAKPTPSVDMTLRLELAAIHRILLDGLKPDWWAKLRQMMQELEEAQGTKTGDILEDRRISIDREHKFLEEISRLPLHAVDPRCWALVQEARRDHAAALSIRYLIEKDSLTPEDRQLAASLLPTWQDIMHRRAERGAEEEVPSGGQGDLVSWFEEHIRSLDQEQYFWGQKLTQLTRP